MIYKYYLKILFLISIFFLILNFNKAYSGNQIIIIAKIDNEIVTNMDIEKERGITILAKPTSIIWRNTRLNIIDTPGMLILEEKLKECLEWQMESFF